MGKVIGSQEGTTSNIGGLTELPSVYYVVNGLSDEESQYWSKSNINEPNLLWEEE